MNRLLVAALFVLGFIPSMSSAVEIKNIRPCYGPFGAMRYNATCLPGDLVFMTYDIDGLALDPKTGKASYETIVELLDSNEKVLFKNPTVNEVLPQLGGTRMPGNLHVIMGAKQAAGKYSIRLTIHDKIGKDAKAFKYPIEVLPETFGFVGVTAPAVQFPGLFYKVEFALVNLTLEKKTKQPDAEVTIRILDEKGVPVAPPVKMEMPRDMPKDTDLEQANFVPLQYPVFLNRPGRFTLEILASDKTGKKEAKVSFGLTVLDLSTSAGK